MNAPVRSDVDTIMAGTYFMSSDILSGFLCKLAVILVYFKIDVVYCEEKKTRKQSSVAIDFREPKYS